MTDGETRWTDQIIGERMQLDQEFGPTVDESQFSRQQWGLVMTAVEFQIERPGDAERAELVADTSKLTSVMPELDRVADQASAPGMQGQGPPDAGGSGGGGLFGGLKDALGFGGGGGSGGGGVDYDEADLEAAEELVGEYATELQAKLEERGKWERVREAAQE